MHKLIGWCKENILLVVTLALLVFIPLYPKLPLIDIQNTWVYIRAEDFFVLFALIIWLMITIQKRTVLRTPLTLPIFTFWIIGGLATLHGILLIFPTVANLFPNVALLSYLRRIEYMSLYFVSYWSMKEKSYLRYVIVTLILTLVGVVAYGLGQKFLGFPAFLTMNEEFAKGTPITLSALSRLPSTFGGHYDLAAYLVLIMPIVVSVMFGLKNKIVAGVLFCINLLGAYVLFLTVSRISLFALIASIVFVLYFHKKRLVLLIIPVCVVALLAMLRFSPGILNRYASTVQEVDVLVDAENGKPIGHAKIVPNTYFEHKTIRQQNFKSTADLTKKNSINDTQTQSTQSGIIIPYTLIPTEVALLTVSSAPTGEDLPQGTGYINLTLSPVVKKLNQFYYELKPLTAGQDAEVYIINGPYLIKKTLAYDLSFTTRFQGEWPNAMAAFRKNILLGSGYGSVSLAVDNSYLRMLGEVGGLGLGVFIALFIITGIIIVGTWKCIDNPLVKHFTIGLAAGIIGLAINAFFIDVFEASKIAFLLWLLMGITLGTLRLYQKSVIHVWDKLVKVITSTYFIILVLCILAFSLLGPMLSNYFIGDDFTWFRWVADCGVQNVVRSHCPVRLSTIVGYFTEANGFFYRPGTKTYFLLMYPIFWLNQNAYHTVSLILHICSSVLVFFLLKKTLQSKVLAAGGAVMFLIIAGYSETVFWIAATGHLVTTCLTLAGLLFFMQWEETKKTLYYVLAWVCAMVSPLFHELGIVTPLLYFTYLFIMCEGYTLRTIWHKTRMLVLLIPIPVYLVFRIAAGSHGLSGDYNYNLMKLPFNVVGNLFGYLMQILGGPLTRPLYEALRNNARDHYGISAFIVVGIVLFFLSGYRKIKTYFTQAEKKTLLFGFFFTVLSLSPFLGFGNIANRYSHMATAGVVIIVVVLLNKLYAYLITQGKDIAISVLAISVGIFGLFHIVQLRRVQDNWNEAGNKVKQFFVSIDSVYDDSWNTTPMEIHFVDVPIKNGEAWVFPVGLSDAVWFAFRNTNIRIIQDLSLANAFSEVTYDTKTQRIYTFDANGGLTEHKKLRGEQ